MGIRDCISFVALCMLQDDVPDEWVPESLIAADILDDWNKQLERAPVAALLDVQQWGTSREYLVHWADGTPVSEAACSVACWAAAVQQYNISIGMAVFLAVLQWSGVHPHVYYKFLAG